ncbi:MAG: hypothetical protein IJE91_04290 [Clostridia bacterium]|nr:hypothetical protein [Clostridia bacterium]
MKNNFLGTDSFAILLKKEKYDEVTQYYKDFGWKIVSSLPHAQYANILIVEFSRNHFVNNKDELQFLQVNMEHDVNSLGKLEKTKHSRSIIVGITLGLLMASFLTMSFCFLLLRPTVTEIILGCACAFTSLVLIVFTLFWLKQNIKKEKTHFLQKQTELQGSIKNYCSQAKSLLEAVNE